THGRRRAGWSSCTSSSVRRRDGPALLARSLHHPAVLHHHLAHRLHHLAAHLHHPGRVGLPAHHPHAAAHHRHAAAHHRAAHHAAHPRAHPALHVIGARGRREGAHACRQRDRRSGRGRRGG